MISVWRIVKPKYANSAFDGEGARLMGGRWNHEGVSVVYTSESLALAALELFVQMDGPPSMALMSIEAQIPEKVSIETLDLNELPQKWNAYPVSTTSQECGSQWILQQQTAILKVPSVIIPNEFNYLVNHQHEDFKYVSIKEPVPFSFDARMWKT